MSDREEIAQIIARAYGGSLYPGLGCPGDYPTDDVDYRAADAIIALIAPSDGWVLVPREPTPEMMKAGDTAYRDGMGHAYYYNPSMDGISNGWSAMLAASPNEKAKTSAETILDRFPKTMDRLSQSEQEDRS